MGEVYPAMMPSTIFTQKESELSNEKIHMQMNPARNAHQPNIQTRFIGILPTLFFTLDTASINAVNGSTHIGPMMAVETYCISPVEKPKPNARLMVSAMPARKVMREASMRKPA